MMKHTQTLPTMPTTDTQPMRMYRASLKLALIAAGLDDPTPGGVVVVAEVGHVSLSNVELKILVKLSELRDIAMIKDCCSS